MYMNPQALTTLLNITDEGLYPWHTPWTASSSGMDESASRAGSAGDKVEGGASSSASPPRMSSSPEEEMDPNQEAPGHEGPAPLKGGPKDPRDKPMWRKMYELSRLVLVTMHGWADSVISPPPTVL